MNEEVATLTEDDTLYLHNAGRKSFQWELWQCCNNRCSFCYLGHENRHTDKERQVASLKDFLHAIDELDYDVYNNVSLIGGEFFQGQLQDPEVRELFFESVQKIAELYVSKKIGSIWLSATLTVGDQADLYETLDTFDKAGVRPHPNYISSGLVLCTSWDAEGRFHIEKSRENWEFHMKKIGDEYPWVKKNTTIILTQPMCELYLSGDFVPRKFRKEFGTDLFYKQPGFPDFDTENVDGLTTLLKLSKEGKVMQEMVKIKKQMNEAYGFQFCPNRSNFRKFLIKYAKDDPDTFDRLFNIEHRADECFRNYNDFKLHDDVRDKSGNVECSAYTLDMVNENCLIEPRDKKHLVIYSTYADSDECMICDRNRIWESVQNGR